MTEGASTSWIGLYLMGETLDPAIITSTLGIESSSEHKKDDPIRKGEAIVGRRKTGVWSRVLRTTQEDANDGLLSAIRLAEELASHRSLSEFGVEESFVDYYAVLTDSPEVSGKGYFELDGGLIKRMAKIGLGLKLEVSTTRE